MGNFDFLFDWLKKVVCDFFDNWRVWCYNMKEIYWIFFFRCLILICVRDCLRVCVIRWFFFVFFWDFLSLDRYGFFWYSINSFFVFYEILCVVGFLFNFSFFVFCVFFEREEWDWVRFFILVLKNVNIEKNNYLFFIFLKLNFIGYLLVVVVLF